MLQKIYDILRTVASRSGSSSTGNYEYLTDFTVGAGGGAPENGSTDYANPQVTGDIKIYKNGTGYLTESVNYNLIEGGGFELIGGAVFSTDEKYTIFKVNV